MINRQDILRRQQGQRLAAARLAAGYRSAREAALENGWPESSYRAHEAGTRTIGLDDAERYASHFRARGVPISAKSILFEDDHAAPPAADVERVPIIAWVAASQMAETGEALHPADANYIAVADLPAGGWFALRVRDDSMDLIAPDGSIILVNCRDRRLVHGKFYVFGVGGEATFKRYVDHPVRLLMPHSQNRNHLPIAPGRDFVVIGRVCRVIIFL